MANCIERTLQQLFSDDISDSEVKESKFKAEVISRDSNSEVKVSDGEATATVTFAPEANKRYSAMAVVGARLTFFKVEKQSAQSLVFNRTSYMMAEKGLPSTTVKQEKLCLADLVGRRKDEIIPGELVVKVWEVSNVIPTASGRQFLKVKLGDDKHTIDLTLWNKDVKVAANLIPGTVVALRNFTMDGFATKAEGEPLNIGFRGDRQPLTSLKAVKEAEVPHHLKNLDVDTHTLKVTGTLNAIDDIKVYNSCPGKPGTKCGKKVRDGALFCEKPSCRVKVAEAILLEDYYANISVFGDDGEIYMVRCFKNTLAEFEEEGSNVEEKLEHLVGKEVSIIANKDKDPAREAVVKRIAFPDICPDIAESPKMELTIGNAEAKFFNTEELVEILRS